MSPKVQLNASGMSRIGLKPATSPRPRTRAPTTCICPSLFHEAHSACGPVVMVGWSMKPPRSSSSSRPAVSAPRTCRGAASARSRSGGSIRRRRDQVSPPSTLSSTVTTVGKRLVGIPEPRQEEVARRIPGDRRVAARQPEAVAGAEGRTRPREPPVVADAERDPVAALHVRRDDDVVGIERAGGDRRLRLARGPARHVDDGRRGVRRRRRRQHEQKRRHGGEECGATWRPG